MPYKDPVERRSHNRLYHKGYYSRNKKVFVANVKQRVRELQAFVDSLKRGRSCLDCGEKNEPFAMDFDHRDRSTKVDGLAALIHNGASRQRLLAEIEKCDLVCATCHRYRTHGQKRSGLEAKMTPSSKG